MPKNILVVTAIIVAVIAIGATASYITLRQEVEEVKETSVATLTQTMEERILFIISTWDPHASLLSPTAPNFINITNRINELEPKSIVIPSLLNLLKHKNPTVRLFAIWSIHTIDIVKYKKYISPDLLAVGLKDEESTVRVLTAATLLGIGDTRGLQILEEATTLNEPMKFTEPPVLISQAAREILEGYKEEGK